MNLLAPLHTIMTPEPITMAPTQSLRDLDEVFKNNNIHHVPVTENDELVGIVSVSDLLLFKKVNDRNSETFNMENFRLKTNTISKIMTSGVAYLNPDDKVNLALELFKKNKFHAIPIVEKQKVVGIVTTHDIIYQLAVDGSAESKYE